MLVRAGGLLTLEGLVSGISTFEKWPWPQMLQRPAMLGILEIGT